MNNLKATIQAAANVTGTVSTGGGKVDQEFDSTSKNAQSGVAIAGELEKYVEKETGLADYVKKTDYASYSKAGVAKVDPVGTRGISIDGDNFLTLVAASPGDIEGRTGKRAITPLTLNMSVKAALSDSKRISDMTEAEKENACETIGAEKKAILSYPTTSSIVLSNKSDIRIPASTTTINLVLASAIPESYECCFSFQSGETATTLTYPGDTIKFVGVDCDKSGDFIPTANKNYEVVIKNLSTGVTTPLLVARVGVY